MIATLTVCLVVSSSILIVAFAWNRIRGVPISTMMPPGFRSAARFVGGPFSFSIAIHLAIILALVIAVHETRARELIILKLDAGSIHAPEGLEPLEFADVPMPPPNTKSPEEFPERIDVNKVFGANSSKLAGTTSDNGLDGLNRHFGNIMNLHPGSGDGNGGGTFPWFIDTLRHKGLDIVLVIDGTKSMDFVMDDVKARMTRLAIRVRQLVPIARIGVVVFGGKGEPLDMQPLTLSTAKLQTFLGSIQAKGGGEWQENTLGAVQGAVTKMDWKPYARKVIVLIGDSPPEPQDFAPLLALIKDFRRNNGTLSGVDVQDEEHVRYMREFWIKVHREEPTPKDIGPLPQFAKQAQAAYKVMAATGGGSIRSLSHDADINQQVMILVFGDKWQDEVSRFASR
ncbi:vWA domain-containing protein [Candidatus Binatus sp.]|uniref:vWA domain-containing protein n=1 Tax=Candidatus Binatus sp. TaxID=2811406 RepID=UPI003BAF97AC